MNRPNQFTIVEDAASAVHSQRKKESNQSLYRQIRETIRRSILSGEFQSSRRLPATRLPAKQFGSSRLTVINAYDQLTAKGCLEGKFGA